MCIRDRVGLGVARALARRGREVVIVEAAGLIGSETSSRNSEVIHAGIYYPARSLKARLCVDGKQALYAYCAERGIAHKRCGKLIVAADDAQIADLEALKKKAEANGVDDLQWLTRDQALALEPQLHCVAALLSPSTGIIDSHGLMLAYLVQFRAGSGYDAPNLKRLLENPKILKLFHFARFDLAALKQYLGAETAPVYCTRTASKLVRTFTDRHGLKDLCRDLIGVEISKQEQSSDWGQKDLTEAQQRYAASDVLHLHQLKAVLDGMLAREGRAVLAQACFDFLPARAALDLAGWPEDDIFAH